MVISVCNEKGGSGKTTIALNLAVKLGLLKEDTLLIDADPQRSIEVFTNIRANENIELIFNTVSKFGSSLGKEVKSLQNKYSSIIIDTGGYTPEYKSTDSGEWEEERQTIGVATVIEVGPECKYVQPGDCIFYQNITAIPIPFYKQGFYSINEHSIMQIVNVGLTERFKNGRK